MSTQWDHAQNYEKKWWNAKKEFVDFSYYKWYAEDLIKQINGIIAIDENTSILEIGSGAGGILTFLHSNNRYAIDPLEYFFSSIPNFRRQRDKNIIYHASKAEALPFKSGRFDLIICDNVLDHCENMDLVLQEMSRVLRNRGLIYLRSNVYSQWGRFIRYLVEILKIDPGHPHTLTNATMLELLKKSKLKIVKQEHVDFRKAWLKAIKSGKIKQLLKAFSLSTPMQTLFILTQ